MKTLKIAFNTLPSINTNLTKWFKEFKNDFLKKEYIPLKILFFVVYGAALTLLPFMTLQARSLGITEEEVGIIYSFMPIAALTAPFLVGVLADHIGNFRILVSSATAVAALASLLFILVPVGRIVHPLPRNTSLEVSCSPFWSQVEITDGIICDKKLTDKMQITLRSCSIDCSSWNNTERKEDKNLFCARPYGCLKNNTGSLFHRLPNDILLTNHPPDHSLAESFVNINLQSQMEEDGRLIYNAYEPFCPQPFQLVTVTTANEDKKCVVKCKGDVLRQHFCSQTEEIEEISPNLTFYSHLLLRLFMEFTLATSMPLFEGAAATVLKEHDGDFGFQRMYANLGMVVLSPISGALIDYASNEAGVDDFRPAIYLYCGLKIFAAIVMLFVNLEFKQSSNTVLKDFWVILKKLEVLMFLFTALVSGSCYGLLETFLFWLLQDLGANKKLMSLTLTVGSVIGIPILMCSTYVLKKLGHVNTLSLGLIVYVLRYLGYTLISNPWLAMPFEALECVTTSLLLVTMVSYSASLATPTTIVTLQSVFMGLYFGVGRAVGSLIGGYLIRAVGINLTFRIMGGIGGITGLVYIIFNFIYLRKRPENNSTTVVQASSSKFKKEDKNSTILAKIQDVDNRAEIVV